MPKKGKEETTQTTEPVKNDAVAGECVFVASCAHEERKKALAKKRGGLTIPIAGRRRERDRKVVSLRTCRRFGRSRASQKELRALLASQSLKGEKEEEKN